MNLSQPRSGNTTAGNSGCDCYINFRSFLLLLKTKKLETDSNFNSNFNIKLIYTSNLYN